MVLTRRTLTALASAAFLVAAAAPSQASTFAFDQYFGVDDDFGFGSQNIIYYYNNGSTFITPFQAGDYYFYYQLPFNADIGLFHYSFLDGQYTEAVYLNDYAI